MDKIIEIDSDEYIKGLEHGWYDMGHSHDNKVDTIELLSTGFSTSIIKCFKFKTINRVIDDYIIDSDSNIESIANTNLYKFECDRVDYYIHEGQFKMLIKAVLKK